MRSPTLLPMRMNAAETSASSATADWTLLTVVSRSCTTAEIETFITDVSTTSTNIAIDSRTASRVLLVVAAVPPGCDCADTCDRPRASISHPPTAPLGSERRGWDSNPRSRKTRDSGFQDRCIRPLCHPSWAANPRYRPDYGRSGQAAAQLPRAPQADPPARAAPHLCRDRGGGGALASAGCGPDRRA